MRQGKPPLSSDCLTLPVNAHPAERKPRTSALKSSGLSMLQTWPASRTIPSVDPEMALWNCSATSSGLLRSSPPQNQKRPSLDAKSLDNIEPIEFFSHASTELSREMAAVVADFDHFSTSHLRPSGPTCLGTLAARLRSMGGLPSDWRLGEIQSRPPRCGGLGPPPDDARCRQIRHRLGSRDPCRPSRWHFRIQLVFGSLVGSGFALTGANASAKRMTIVA